MNKANPFTSQLRFLARRYLPFVQSIFRILARFVRKLKYNNAKNNWYISQKGNEYNPILSSTVYPYGNSWNIARHNQHFQWYSSKEDAKRAAFKMWLQENPTLHEFEPKLPSKKMQ